MTRHRFRDPPPLPADAPAYVDDRSAQDYAQQKRAAESRQRTFDEAPRPLRELWNATGTPGFALNLWRQGVRTFDDAERRVADE